MSEDNFNLFDGNQPAPAHERAQVDEAVEKARAEYRARRAAAAADTTNIGVPRDHESRVQLALLMQKREQRSTRRSSGRGSSSSTARRSSRSDPPAVHSDNPAAAADDFGPTQYDPYPENTRDTDADAAKLHENWDETAARAKDNLLSQPEAVFQARVQDSQGRVQLAQKRLDDASLQHPCCSVRAGTVARLPGEVR